MTVGFRIATAEDAEALADPVRWRLVSLLAEKPRSVGVLAQLASSGEAVSAIDLRFRAQVVLKPVVR